MSKSTFAISTAAFLAPSPVSLRTTTLTTPLLSHRNSLPHLSNVRRSTRPLNVPVMNTNPEKPVKRYKRLIVLSDGSWQTLENPQPTNILTIGKSICREDENGIQQVVFYDPGVGTNNGPIDRIVGGGVGEGIDKNIKQLYTFLALNYEHGDEVYMFGFSRGSYTVRSLVGMINHSGLTRRDAVDNVEEAYNLYRDTRDPDAQVVVDFRSYFGSRIPIKLLMCFDTVGALGLPRGGIFFNKKRYEFHDTLLPAIVENAIHHVSSEEDRLTFKPTPMKPTSEDNPSQVTEKVFWGGHGGVGGGDVRHGEIQSANASLIALVDEMERRGLGLKFDKDRLPNRYDDTVEVTKFSDLLYKADKLLFGTYIRNVEDVGNIHPSAIRRYQKRSDWRPPAFKDLEGKILEWSG